MQNNLNNKNNTNYTENDIQIQNIILTTISDDEDDESNKEKNGIFSRFFIFFKIKKEDKDEEENINANNELETLEQKLRNEAFDKKHNNNYNISLIPDNNENNNFNDISKLKKRLDEEEGLIDYGQENANKIENNNPNNQHFVESQNIYLNFNNNNNDEYSIRAGTNIGQIVRKNSKYCQVLLVVLIGAAGLLFLIYKNRKIREIMLGILKVISDFFKGLFGMLGQGIEDFLEKYNDIWIDFYNFNLDYLKIFIHIYS